MLDLDNIFVKALSGDNKDEAILATFQWHNGERCEAFENDAGRENR